MDALCTLAVVRATEKFRVGRELATVEPRSSALQHLLVLLVPGGRDREAQAVLGVQAAAVLLGRLPAERLAQGPQDRVFDNAGSGSRSVIQ